MSRSILSSRAGVWVFGRRGSAALVVASCLGMAGVAGAADVPASSSTATVGNSPAGRVEPSNAPATASAYFELAMQEAARISDGKERSAAYSTILLCQLAAGDITAAQQSLPRTAEQERGMWEGRIALATVAAAAAQGHFAEARALNERIENENTRRQGEAAITQAEALDLVKSGKGEEALQIVQDQEEPSATIRVLCLLVRSFALEKDAPRARRALDLAIDAMSDIGSDERGYSRYLAEAEATVGDSQAARARASGIAHPQARDIAYCFIAGAQVRIGDVDTANQTMASVDGGRGARAFGYGLCANVALERKDEANARRFVQQAIAAKAAGFDTSALTLIVGAQTQLGDTSEALALVRAESKPMSRALAYQIVAEQETLRAGPAVAQAWVEGLESPLERAYAWGGIARGLTERQKRADTKSAR